LVNQSNGPQYDRALEQVSRVKIIRAIAKSGGVAKFSEISKMTGVKDNNLLHHLNVLIKYQVVEQVGHGPYALKYKTPLLFLFDDTPSRKEAVYVGLLGDKGTREEPETKVALGLLQKEGFDIILRYVVTSSNAAQSWKDMDLADSWIHCDGQAITDIDLIIKKVEPLLTDLIREHLVIMDCTSFNKPATIAFYELAQKYMVPLVYIYEPKRKLTWLISRKLLTDRFKI
jgi:hypothetical protein